MDVGLSFSISLLIFIFSSFPAQGKCILFEGIHPVAVAKEEGVEALPDLVSGDVTTSDPGPGLTTLRLIQSNWKTAIESALSKVSRLRCY